MRSNFIPFLLTFSLSLILNSCSNKDKAISKQAKRHGDIYQFDKIKRLNDNYYDFSDLKGKKVIIVNTASKCGLTGQYKDLQALYEKYNSAGLEIIGFPSNDFNQQEPGTNSEISTFCSLNYGVTFPMMSKVKVKGEEIHRVYKYLKENSPKTNNVVKWNFQKYLIGEEGLLEKIIDPQINPQDSSIVNWIEN